MAIWRYGKNYRLEIDNYHGLQEEVYREAFDTLPKAVKRFNELKEKAGQGDFEIRYRKVPNKLRFKRHERGKRYQEYLVSVDEALMTRFEGHIQEKTGKRPSQKGLRGYLEVFVRGGIVDLLIKNKDRGGD
jgi:hypothetical protein